MFFVGERVKPFGSLLTFTRLSDGRAREPWMFTTLSRKKPWKAVSECSRVCTHSLNIQSSSELEETSRVTVSGRMRTQLHAMGSEECHCKCPGKEQGLHHGLDHRVAVRGSEMALILLADGTAPEQALGAFSAGFFWRSKFHGLQN